LTWEYIISVEENIKQLNKLNCWKSNYDTLHTQLMTIAWIKCLHMTQQIVYERSLKDDMQ